MTASALALTLLFRSPRNRAQGYAVNLLSVRGCQGLVLPGVRIRDRMEGWESTERLRSCHRGSESLLSRAALLEAASRQGRHLGLAPSLVSMAVVPKPCREPTMVLLACSWAKRLSSGQSQSLRLDPKGQKLWSVSKAQETSTPVLTVLGLQKLHLPFPVKSCSSRQASSPAWEGEREGICQLCWGAWTQFPYLHHLPPPKKRLNLFSSETYISTVSCPSFLGLQSLSGDGGLLEEAYRGHLLFLRGHLRPPPFPPLLPGGQDRDSCAIVLVTPTSLGTQQAKKNYAKTNTSANAPILYRLQNSIFSVIHNLG